MKSNHVVLPALGLIVLLALAASFSQAMPDGPPTVAPTSVSSTENPEWRAGQAAISPASPPAGVVAPLTHKGRRSPNVPEPPPKIASLKPAAASPSDPWSELTGLDLTSTALMYRGVPYRWAGMSSRGMDCSGLVSRVLRMHGIRAPHQSSQLFRLGMPVGLHELQAGDLVFFRTRRRGIGHVGMYLGNGKFIHASSSAGRVVISPLKDYMSIYVGARRLR